MKTYSQKVAAAERSSCKTSFARFGAGFFLHRWLLVLLFVLPGRVSFSAVFDGSGGLHSTYTVNPVSMEPGMGFAAGWRTGLHSGDVATVTAIPFAGYTFDHWLGSGYVVSTSAQYSFTVTWDVNLFAVFRPLFPPGTTFVGLFSATNGAALHRSGSFIFTATPHGKFTGKLQVVAARYAVTGQFDSDGRAIATVQANETNALTVDMRLLREDPYMLTGTVGDGTWSAKLTAERLVYDARTNASPAAGSYTLAIPGVPDSDALAAGHGYGTLTVNNAGKVRFNGSLADGTRVTQATILPKSGRWPLYSSLYGGRGSLIGWLTFSNAPAADLGGDLAWIKLSGAPGKLYQSGFSVLSTAWGSSYQRPQTEVPALHLEECQVQLIGGDLSSDLTGPGVFGPRNSLSVPGVNQIKLTIDPATGLFRGHFMDPANLRNTVCAGVVLQKANFMRGYFLGMTQSGAVEVGPLPASGDP